MIQSNPVIFAKTEYYFNNEDVYSYFSPRNQSIITKKFFVIFPESSMIYGDDTEQTYDEFEIELNQCGEA